MAQKLKKSSMENLFFCAVFRNLSNIYDGTFCELVNGLFERVLNTSLIDLMNSKERKADCPFPKAVLQRYS